MAYATTCVLCDNLCAIWIHLLGTGGELNSSIDAFKSARLFDPVKITDLAPDSAMVEDLKAFPFLHGSKAHLHQELPTYLAAAAAEGVSPGLEQLKWWKKHETTLPFWAAACQQVLLCQPSSAAVERVFSSLNNSFNDEQSRALEDMLNWHYYYNITKEHNLLIII